MKQLTVFYLEGCPYCANAKKAVEELRAEMPGFENVLMNWVEESYSPNISSQYDYYYVPTVFCGYEKLYECKPGDDFDTIKQSFKKAIESVIGE